MSILVYAESSDGKFKKSSLEAISFAKSIADKNGSQVIAASIGEIGQDDLQNLSKYGASKIYSIKDSRLKAFSGQPFTSAIFQIAQAESPQVIIFSNSFIGRSIAPRLSVKMNAGFVPGVISLPESDGAFHIQKTAFSGKGIAMVEILSPVKILTLNPNSYKLVESPVQSEIKEFTPVLTDADFKVQVKETIRSTDKIPLPEAERVVSGGRGLKGPENWNMIEELAEILDAATACSKPVSDASWRPHSEHVGQTGIAISPNLYIAIGISGAIQHLAGVSSSKVIVVINKDPEAPFFKVADYGIVGDAFEVVPKLIDALKKFKANQN